MHLAAIHRLTRLCSVTPLCHLRTKLLGVLDLPYQETACQNIFPDRESDLPSDDYQVRYVLVGQECSTGDTRILQGLVNTCVEIYG